MGVWSGVAIALGGAFVYGSVLSFLASRRCFFCCITSRSCSSLHLVFEFSRARVLAVSHFLHVSPDLQEEQVGGLSRLHWQSLPSQVQGFDEDGWPSHCPYEQEAWLQPAHLPGSSAAEHECFCSF